MRTVEYRNFATVILAIASYLGLESLRRLLAKGSAVTERLTLTHGASQQAELGKDLRTPQRLLVLYAVLRSADLLLDGLAAPAFVLGLGALAAFVGATAVLRLLSTLLLSLVRSRGGPDVPRILRSLIDFALTFVAAGVVLRSKYQLDLSSLLATSAVLSVVLGFALQETLGNLFSGLTLHAEQPFGRGDWISFSKYYGRVVDVGWRSTRIVTLENDDLTIPNSLLAREPVVNHSRPTLMEAVDLMLTIDMDVAPARAKEVLLEAVRGCARVMQTPEPLVQLAAFGDHGATYRVRFFYEDHNAGRAVRDEVHTAIWYALRRAAVEMPYPQQTVSYRERAADADERRRKEHFAEAQDLLSRIDFVAALSGEARRILSERARFLEYGPGQAVVRQGEQGDTFYLVARGECAVRIKVEAGEKEVARLGRGKFFGEMSLLTGDPRTATVVATTDAALLAIDRDAFERVFAQDPDVAQELAAVIARRRLALESARAEGAAATQAVEKEASNLLGRIRSIFGRARAAG
jgi:small-conductance mechanosensitive channel/CRP-like cAMP-binding protein